MHLSIELPCRPSKPRMNIRVLTEIRQNFQISKEIGTSIRMTRFKTPRTHNKQTSRINISNVNISKKTLTSFKSISRKNGGWLPTICNEDGSSRVEAVKQQILAEMMKKEQIKSNNIKSTLQKIFEIGENINESFYNYKNVEMKIKLMNAKVKELKSTTCQFYCYVISALILFEYSSLSLTIFYFDKALKVFSNKKFAHFDCLNQMIIYKYTAKVFLQTNKLKQAKDMAYMYLRKTWKYHDLDQEMNAYDLLGQIQLEQGNIELSRYFHWRMCHDVRQSKEIIQMSNQQLRKRQGIKYQFSVYEDITSFIKSEEGIVSILHNHFRAEAEEEAKGFNTRWKNKQIFLYTHRSSNRLLRNHRSLERRLVDQKQSNQLHFIKPKDIKKLRKIITEFNSFIFDLKRQWEIQFLREEMENSKLQFQTF